MGLKPSPPTIYHGQGLAWGNHVRFERFRALMMLRWKPGGGAAATASGPQQGVPVVDAPPAAAALPEASSG